MGFTVMDFYSNNALYGPWILFAEIVICGILPALILIVKPLRETTRSAVYGHHPGLHRRVPQPLGHGPPGDGGTGDAL